MEDGPAITTLKDFINFYSTFKSDVEIASLLDISLNEIETTRNSSLKVSGNEEKILHLL